jgi:hypothetical protein
LFFGFILNTKGFNSKKTGSNYDFVMPVPTHDVTCTSRAIPIQCQHCGESVWYFSCTCGTRVFFNELGWPWEVHYCKEYFIRKNLEMLVDLDKMSPEEIYRLIVKRERLSGEEIDNNIWEIVESVLSKRRSKLHIEVVDPEEGNTEVSGKVIELISSINTFKRLGYDASNEISVKLLGKLAKGRWALARIRTNPDRRNKCLEFEILIGDEYLKKNSLKQGDTILGLAKGVTHSKGMIWVLQKHDVY